MMYLRDAAKLAYTKLRTRRLRLVVTLSVMSLLFAGLVTASFVVRGLDRSLRDFSSEGFASRYILSGEGGFQMVNNSDPKLIALAESIQKDIIARKTAYAKANGIIYDPKSEEPVLHEFGDDRSVNTGTAAGQQAIEQYSATQPKIDRTSFEKQLSAFEIKKVYEVKSTAYFGFNMPTLTVMKDGKEDFETQRHQNPYGSDLNSLSSQWQLMDPSLMQPFVLEGQDLSTTNGLPIIVPYKAAQQILGLQTLPPGATADQKKERLREVRQRIAGHVIEACYRNSVSQRLVDDAIGQQTLLKQQADDKDFPKPSLIYDVPQVGCGAPQLVQDKRTVEEKQVAAKDEQFRRAFGEAAPVSQTVQLRVVGVSPGLPGSEGSVGFADVLSAFTSSTIGSGWVSPLSALETTPILQDVFKEQPMAPMDTTKYLAEFHTAEAARTAMKEASCQINLFGASDPFASCIKEGKPYLLMPFGSASLAVSDAIQIFSRAFLIAGGVVALIAALIMMGVIGRVIADSRRETAVFRSVGASKFDIAQIYAVYTMYLVALTVVASIALGALGARIIGSFLEEDLSVAAVVAFSVQDLDKWFSLFAWHWMDIGFVAATIVVAGIISGLAPIIGNVRRSPMQDMRDE